MTRLRVQTISSAAALASLLACLGLSFADRPTAAAPLATRAPWNGSRMIGSPDPPPPFKVVRAYPQVTFKQPLFMVRAHGLDRWFVGERPGAIYSLSDKPGAQPELAFDVRTDLKLPPPVGKRKVSGQWLYALAFHPAFEKNRYCYICYTMSGVDPNESTRISRFAVTNATPPRLDPTSEEVIIAWPAGGHNGCDLHFGSDGMLYISTGDSKEPSPPDPLNTGQDCSDLLSSILRIDVDRKDPQKNYAVPKNNPFVGMKSVRGEIWAYGLRNPWRMSFDRKTGDLWVGDVGWELWETVHKVEKGANFGWSIKEGPQTIKPDQKPGPTPVITPPAIELPHTVAASVTGGYVYRGKKFPELVGAYVFGDYETRRIWAARFEGGRVKEMPEITRPTVRVSTFAEDRDGELYFLDYDRGTVHTLERADSGDAANKNFPTKLSETGLYGSVKDHTPAPGVQPFHPAAEQWADHAAAEHWIALPGTSALTVFPGKGKPIPAAPFGVRTRLHYPKDAVLAKTLRLESEAGNPKSVRRVETQLLHFDGVDWRGYTFAWRDDQSDADLVPAEGTEKDFAVRDPAFAGGTRRQTWTFPSRNQCFQCHTMWSDYSMAFNPAQLNHDAERGGKKQNQLAWLSEQGFIRRAALDDQPLSPFDAASAASEAKLHDPFDAAGGTLDQRARSYLHVNCGHCHRYNGGGTVQLELHLEAKAAAMKAIDVPPQAGDFGIANARIIAPGDPERSIAYYRMAKFGRGRMPHFGSEWPDSKGLGLIAEWVRDLKGGKPATAVELDLKQPEKSLASPQAALPLARAMGRLATDDRERVLSAAAKLPAGGNVRDLFEGYLPSDGKGRRLGANPRPASILAQTGDAKRGEALFWTESMRCEACHKIGERGNSVGPDLSAIGKTRTKAELLESLLDPSRRIEPQFTAFAVRTADGRTVTGLLVTRNDKRVVVRDAQNKDHSFEAGDVEQVQASRTSQMPDGLLSVLTPQEAADLLEYLTSRK